MAARATRDRGGEYQTPPASASPAAAVVYKGRAGMKQESTACGGGATAHPHTPWGGGEEGAAEAPSGLPAPSQPHGGGARSRQHANAPRRPWRAPPNAVNFRNRLTHPPPPPLFSNSTGGHVALPVRFFFGGLGRLRRRLAPAAIKKTKQ